MADPQWPHVAAFLGRLEDVRPDGAGWKARCPAHDDDDPSLGVAESGDGKILVNCRSGGCDARAVTKALGLPMSALFPPRPGSLTDRIVTAYDYSAADGTVLFQVVRLRDPKDFRQRKPDGAGGWTWKTKGVPKVPYRLPELLAADPAAPVFVVEGEKDADNLAALGLAATTNPGGAGKWKHLDQAVVKQALSGRAVVVLPDNDPAGVGHGKDVAKRLRGVAGSVKVLALPGLPDKGDVSDWLAAGGTADALISLASEAPSAPAAGESDESGESLPFDTSRKNRKRVQVHDREYLVNDEATRAMVNSVGLYQRSNSLVRVLEQEADSPETAVIRRVQGSPIISDLSRASLREELTRVVEFYRVKKSKDGEEEVVIPPPDFCVAAVWDRKAWPGVPHLRAVVSHPVLLPDGRILAENGFDPASGLFLHMSGLATLDVPENPTHGDAAAAIALLLDVVADFPFASDSHKAAWVASLLTPAAWFAFAGPAPFFLVNGNCRGAGKGLLVDVAGLILTGRRFSVMSYDHDATELRKRITSLAAEGERLVLLDNLTGNVGNGTLDAALTGEAWRDRILGVSRMFNGPLNVVWYGTGNNVVLCGDTPRRTCEVRLETEKENPEERDDFRHPDLRGHVLGDRSRLLSAVMTVLRAWAVAGKPRDNTLTPWGSYEGWSDVVRQAVVWAGLKDPGRARMSVQASADPAREAMGFVFKKLLTNVAEKKDGAKKGHTAGEIVELAKQDGELRSAIEDLCGRLDSRTLGSRLKHFCRTPISGYYLDRGPVEHQAVRWVVRPIVDLKKRDGLIGGGSPNSPNSPGADRPRSAGGEFGEFGEPPPIKPSQKNGKPPAGSNGTYPPPDQPDAGETKARDGDSDPSDGEASSWL